jgi:Zinc knuckle
MHKKLCTQNVKTPAAVKVRDEVCQDMCDVLQVINILKDTFGNYPTASFETSLNEVREEIKAEIRAEIKALGDEMKETMKSEKTYAQATVAAPTSKPGSLGPRPSKVHEQRTTTRQEQAKLEVTLQATTDDAKEKLSAMSYKEITEGIQTTINTNVFTDNKPVLFGVSKPTNDGTVRLRCKTEEDAKTLRKLDWEAATKGLQVRKPKYGIVVHKVDKSDYDSLMDPRNLDTIKQMQQDNELSIANIAPLLRKDDNDSIIIFTTNLHKADRCIKQGIYINYCLYNAQKFAPELQTTQCYNCGEYGHRVAQCKKKHRCGKCGKDNHGTRDCKHTGKPKCSNCQGNHENWHHECPTRTTERRRLNGLRSRTSPFFTS